MERVAKEKEKEKEGGGDGEEEGSQVDLPAFLSAGKFSSSFQKILSSSAAQKHFIQYVQRHSSAQSDGVAIGLSFLEDLEIYLSYFRKDGGREEKKKRDGKDPVKERGGNEGRGEKEKREREEKSERRKRRKEGRMREGRTRTGSWRGSTLGCECITHTFPPHRRSPPRWHQSSLPPLSLLCSFSSVGVACRAHYFWKLRTKLRRM